MPRRTLEEWLARLGEVRPFLPIKLGNKKESGKVRNLDDVRCVLEAAIDEPAELPHADHVRRCQRTNLCTESRPGQSHHNRHHKGQPEGLLDLLQDLIAELLVADLNRALDASRGQDLSKAFVYGQLQHVRDVLRKADDVVGSSLQKCEIPTKQVVDAILALQSLEAINAGEVTFVSPNLEPSPSTTPPVIGRPAAGPAAAPSGKSL
jgi:hypothetical protein